MKFDPTEHGNDDGGGGNAERLAVAGYYMLVVTSTERGSSQNGKEYLLARIKVIAGPQKDCWFHERIYLNDKSLWKLGKLCKAMGHTEAFELDNDRDIRAAICHKPFKGRVAINRQGDKAYPEITGYYYDLRDDEVMQADAYVAERDARRELDGGGDDDSGGWDDAPPPGDEDAPPPRRGARRAPQPQDDDIPF